MLTKAIPIVFFASLLAVLTISCNNDDAMKSVAPKTGQFDDLPENTISVSAGEVTKLESEPGDKSLARTAKTSTYESPEIQMQAREYRGSDQFDLTIVNAIETRPVSADKRSYEANDDRYVKEVPANISLYDDHGTFTFKGSRYEERVPAEMQSPKRETRVRKENPVPAYDPNLPVKEMIEDARRRGCDVTELGRSRYDVDCFMATAPHDPSVRVNLQVKMTMNLSTSEVERTELYYEGKKVSEMSGNIARNFLNTTFYDQDRKQSIEHTVKFR